MVGKKKHSNDSCPQSQSSPVGLGGTTGVKGQRDSYMKVSCIVFVHVRCVYKTFGKNLEFENTCIISVLFIRRSCFALPIITWLVPSLLSCLGGLVGGAQAM